MMVRHLEFMVEDPSTEAFLRALLPRILPEACTFDVHPFQDKPDLLDKLAARLRGYARWLPANWRIVVVVDRDDDDCHALKEQLEAMAAEARLRSRSRAGTSPWQLVNRIAIEELEAWYFGDWKAVCLAYPKAPPTVPNQASYRDPDEVRGGTWEAFERILQRRGYFRTGLRKVEAARAIGAHLDPTRNQSHSFKVFSAALMEACG